MADWLGGWSLESEVKSLNPPWPTKLILKKNLFTIMLDQCAVSLALGSHGVEARPPGGGWG